MSEWPGMTSEEWLKRWDSYGWRGLTKLTLIEIASCREVDASDRLIALSTLNDAFKFEVLVADESFPTFMCQTLIDITKGGRGWWWQRWYLRPRMKARLFGAINLINLAANMQREIRAESESSKRKPLLS